MSSQAPTDSMSASRQVLLASTPLRLIQRIKRLIPEYFCRRRISQFLHLGVWFDLTASRHPHPHWNYVDVCTTCNCYLSQAAKRGVCRTSIWYKSINTPSCKRYGIVSSSSSSSSERHRTDGDADDVYTRGTWRLMTCAEHTSECEGRWCWR